MIDYIKMYFGLTPEHKTARKNLRELSALTNHELNDIGVCRGDIHYLAYEPVRELKKKLAYEAGDHYMRGKPVATWKGKAHA